MTAVSIIGRADIFGDFIFVRKHPIDVHIVCAGDEISFICSWYMAETVGFEVEVQA